MTESSQNKLKQVPGTTCGVFDLLSSKAYLEITEIQLIAHLFTQIHPISPKKELIGIIFKRIKHLDNKANSV